MKEAHNTTLTMKREFSAKPETVFDAWINSEKMSKWLFTLENTNKVTQNNTEVGGKWEIIDVREGVEYRAIGEYLVIDPPRRLEFTFNMPQFNQLEDTITVEINENSTGCEMTFTHLIHVETDESWTKTDTENALIKQRDQMEYGWNLMFMGLKALAETGDTNFKG